MAGEKAALALLGSLGEAGDGLVAVDIEGTLLQCNDVAAAMLGIDAAASVGKRCWEVMPFIGAGGALCVEDCLALQAAASRRSLAAQRVLSPPSDRSFSLASIVLCGPSGQPALLLHILHRPASEDGAENGSEAGDSPAAVAHRLTPREQQVLHLLLRGADSRHIATTLCVSRTTARNHVQNILRKLGAHSKLEAVARASGRNGGS